MLWAFTFALHVAIFELSALNKLYEKSNFDSVTILSSSSRETFLLAFGFPFEVERFREYERSRVHLRQHLCPTMKIVCLFVPANNIIKILLDVNNLLECTFFAGNECILFVSFAAEKTIRIQFYIHENLSDFWKVNFFDGLFEIMTNLCKKKWDIFSCLFFKILVFKADLIFKTKIEKLQVLVSCNSARNCEKIFCFASWVSEVHSKNLNRFFRIDYH